MVGVAVPCDDVLKRISQRTVVGRRHCVGALPDFSDLSSKRTLGMQLWEGGVGAIE